MTLRKTISTHVLERLHRFNPFGPKRLRLLGGDGNGRDDANSREKQQHRSELSPMRADVADRRIQSPRRERGAKQKAAEDTTPGQKLTLPKLTLRKHRKNRKINKPRRQRRDALAPAASVLSFKGKGKVTFNRDDILARLDRLKRTEILIKKDAQHWKHRWDPKREEWSALCRRPKIKSLPGMVACDPELLLPITAAISKDRQRLPLINNAFPFQQNDQIPTGTGREQKGSCALPSIRHGRMGSSHETKNRLGSRSQQDMHRRESPARRH